MADGAKLGQQAITMPSGNTAARPGSPVVGDIRYNTQTDALENYTSTSGWLKVSVPVPTISAVTGTIYAGIANNLTITGAFLGNGIQGSATFTHSGGSSTANATHQTLTEPASQLLFQQAFMDYLVEPVLI